MRDIGKNIRDLRIRENMTQDELAEKLHVTRQTVSNYETGRSRPDVDMLTLIAQALNTDPNTILYGHRMNNGTMFADISKYSNGEFFEKHPYVLIITPDAKYKAEVFSAYIANTTYSSWDMTFDGDDIYLQWLETLQSRSYFHRDVGLTAEDRILTLSTCTYEFEDARFIVHAILREAE